MDTKKGLPPTLPPYTQASAVTPPTSFHTSFASVSMHMSDRLRLLNFPPEIVTLLRTTISSSWPRGIQSETPNYHGAHEFKLRGNPWRGHSEEGVLARRLMSRVLAALYKAGWLLSVVTDVSKKLTDLDTLVFRHAPAEPSSTGESGGLNWMCVHFSMGDRLKLIDAPDDLNTSIVGLAARMGMLQTHQPYWAGNAYEVKMLGYPWQATGGETMLARRFVLGLLGVLEESGWSVYASIDQKGQVGENSGDLDTWHCMKRRDWAPGLPVYHR